MMLHSDMSAFLGNFGCPAAAEQLQLFKRQNSFEDEVESIYLSNLKKQDQQQQQPQDVAKTATAGGGLNLAAACYQPDLYDSMEFAVARPEDVTGQTLAAPIVEDPEEDVSNILDANFDFSTLNDDDDDEIMVGVTDTNANAAEIEGQKFIDEMKGFLDQFEEPAPNAGAVQVTQQAQEVKEERALPETLAEELLSMEQLHTLNNMPNKFPALDVNEQAQADELLDMLLASEQEEQQQHTDIVQEAMVGLDLHDDSGFQGDESVIVQEPVVASGGVPAAQALPDTQQTYKVSNITQLRTADGKNIIILVQPSVQRPAAVINDSLTAPAVINNGLTAAVVDNSSTAAAVEEDEAVVIDDSDSDWTPEDKATSSSSKARSISKKKPGRKPEARSSAPVSRDGKVGKRSYKGIKDKKLRKQKQNVDAARRYRDKKKKEELEIEEEEKRLSKINIALKKELKEKEMQFEMFKKLMEDLGYAKFE